MAISSINVTKFGAGRVEGTITVDSDGTHVIEVDKVSGPFATPPYADVVCDAAGTFPFVITKFASASATEAGLPPASDYFVDEQGGSAHTVSALHIDEVKGPRAGQLVLHTAESSPGVLDPASRMDLGEYLRGELELIKDVAGLDADAAESLGFERHLDGFSGALLGSFTGSIKEAIQLLVDQIDANSAMLGTGTFWNSAVADLTALAAQAASASYVNGDATYVIDQKAVYVKVDSSVSDEDYEDGNGVKYRKIIDMASALTEIEAESDSVRAIFGIPDGTDPGVNSGPDHFGLFAGEADSDNNGAVDSAVLNHAEMDALSTLADRTMKNIFQALISRDAAHKQLLDDQDEELRLLRRSIEGASHETAGAYDGVIDFATDHSGAGASLVDGMTVQSALTALESALETQSFMSFDKQTIASAATDVKALGAWSGMTSKSYYQIWINGVLVAVKDSGGVKEMAEQDVQIGDEVVILNSRR